MGITGCIVEAGRGCDILDRLIGVQQVFDCQKYRNF